MASTGGVASWSGLPNSRWRQRYGGRHVIWPARHTARLSAPSQTWASKDRRWDKVGGVHAVCPLGQIVGLPSLPLPAAWIARPAVTALGLICAAWSVQSQSAPPLVHTLRPVSWHYPDTVFP